MVSLSNHEVAPSHGLILRQAQDEDPGNEVCGRWSSPLPDRPKPKQIRAFPAYFSCPLRLARSCHLPIYPGGFNGYGDRSGGLGFPAWGAISAEERDRT